MTPILSNQIARSRRHPPHSLPGRQDITMFNGCGTELIAPVDERHHIDEHAYRSLVRDQATLGADFLIAGGAVQEALCLTCAERVQLVSATMEETRRRTPVIAGLGSTPLAAALDHARELESLGVAGLLLNSPDRRLHSQREIYGYALALADASSLPITLTNDPARTGINWEPETLCGLARVDNIVAVLERSGSVRQMFATIQCSPENFLILSGDDQMMVTRMAMGARGAVSVMANRIPREMKFLVDLCQRGDFITAAKFYQHCLPLFDTGAKTNKASMQPSYLH